MESHTEELPEYSPAARPPTGTGNLNFGHEHRYALQDRSGREWLSFKMKSRAADPKHAPLFFDGDRIKGVVQLDLAKAQTLKGLTITVRCDHGASSVELSLSDTRMAIFSW